MKRLKKFLFFILTLIALWLITALFIDGNINVVRSVDVDRPTMEVFGYVSQLKNQSEYSVWSEMDPFTKRDYEGTDGEIGFISKWDSDSANVGKGEQEITNIQEGVRIDYELRFLKPDEMTAKAFITTESLSESSTKVSWGFNSKMPYPFNVMRIFMNFEKMLGPDLENGLNNLKGILENTPD